MSTPLIHIIDNLTQKLTDQGFENINNEIIWYLEFLQLCNRQQIYSDIISTNNKIQNALDIFYMKRSTGMPFQYIIQHRMIH